ncbi:hypothetical protein C2845_PM13G02180 [Panicum miliaceum]|uniref:Galectin n=1 Tax=Panicum miliaceum TaxID=4540 RepID=A0A3L6RIQ4_PANMI|nr:hypothetical protein C2845_PM13G02180 [Panicum miliaceum]
MARRVRPSHLVLALGAAYLLLVSLKFRRVLDLAAADLAGDPAAFSSPSSADHLPPGGSNHTATSTSTPAATSTATAFPVQPFWHRYDRVSLPDPAAARASRGRTALDRMADDAWALGLAAWEEAAAFAGDPWALLASATARASDASRCPSAVSQRARGRVVFLPCGLAAGSSVSVVGTPRAAHREFVPQLARMRQGDGTVMVSQFMVELQGLRAVDGEEPPRILHLNPRLRGDWSQHPILEHNTCYRMQWGAAQRCDGTPADDSDDKGTACSACFG